MFKIYEEFGVLLELVVTNGLTQFLDSWAQSRTRLGAKLGPFKARAMWHVECVLNAPGKSKNG